MPRLPPSVETSRARTHLGRCLALARERSGQAQGDVAVALGVSRPTLSAWERGLAEPLALDLQRLADLYGVTLDQLVGRADLPPPVRGDT